VPQSPLDPFPVEPHLQTLLTPAPLLLLVFPSRILRCSPLKRTSKSCSLIFLYSRYDPLPPDGSFCFLSSLFGISPRCLFFLCLSCFVSSFSPYRADPPLFSEALGVEFTSPDVDAPAPPPPPPMLCPFLRVFLPQTRYVNRICGRVAAFNRTPPSQFRMALAPLFPLFLLEGSRAPFFLFFSDLPSFVPFFPLDVPPSKFSGFRSGLKARCSVC